MIQKVDKMTERLENLEKEFIIDEDIEQEDIQQLISRILKFCKIDKNLSKPEAIEAQRILSDNHLYSYNAMLQ